MKISKTNCLMPRLIKKQAAGNQTVAEFCQSHHIKPHKFFYWKRKIKERGKNSTKDVRSTSKPHEAFIPISLPAISDTELSDKIELHFPSGLRAYIPTSTGTTALKAIIKTCGNWVCLHSVTPQLYTCPYAHWTFENNSMGCVARYKISWAKTRKAGTCSCFITSAVTNWKCSGISLTDFGSFIRGLRREHFKYHRCQLKKSVAPWLQSNCSWYFQGLI